MSLVADLTTFDMGEIFFLMTHFRKTGLLSLTLPGGEGKIHFQDGNAVCASFEDLRGTEALYRLFLESKGSVEFAPGVLPEERTIEEDSERIVEELDRRRVELRELTRKLPPFDTVLQRAAEPPAGTVVAVRRTDWHLLGLIDGKRTIESVIANSRMGVLEACKTISWLLTHGLILDPGAMVRALEEEVTFVNALLDELCAEELGWEPWGQLIGRELDRELAARQVSRVVAVEESHLRVAHAEGWAANEDDIRALFATLQEALEKEAVAELGPVLARRKVALVRARLPGVAKAESLVTAGGDDVGGGA